MMIRLLRTLRARDDERGVALIAVVGIGTVLMLLLATMLSVSTSGAVKSSRDSDWNNAMAAAYAGLADYQSRLTADNTYVYYGATTNFSGTSTYSALPAGQTNSAFDSTKSGNWTTVANSNGRESYRYEVDNSDYAGNGVVHVRVTGRANTTTRSLVADLKGDGFINYLYFTDYESSDPSVTGETQAGSTTKLCVSQHQNEAGYNANAACNPVQFIAKDKLYGPVRTNDVLTICGATFYQSVQSTAAAGSYNLPSNCSSPAVFKSGTVQNVQSIEMPQTNGNMLQETRYDNPVTVPRPGCLYTGPTSITFNGNGTMTVVSPWTQATQVTADSDGNINGGRSTGDAATLCGTIAALHTTSGATIAQLPSNLIYVQTVPTGNKDPNTWTASKVASFSNSTTPVFCNQTVKGVAVYGNGLGYPQTNEYVGSAGAASIYGCRNGDAFVKGSFGGGSVPGAMTIGSQNYLYVTGDIVYKNPSKDILGLVGQKAVTIWNPVSCSEYNGSVCSTDSGDSALLARSAGASTTVNAAIASNLGTFQVQNYGFGPQLGTLTILGSIAQKFRGAVGVSYSSSNGRTTWQTGYTKSYGYDSRLQATAPPKFLQPVTTSYGITTQVEVSAAYAADGTHQ